MTKQEAIQTIKQLDFCVGNTCEDCYKCLAKDYTLALDMAVEALEQPQIVYCKDCKYWKKRTWTNGEVYGIFCELTHYEKSPNDFCSLAQSSLT